MAKMPVSFGNDEQLDWELTQKKGTVMAYKQFLSTYPHGKFFVEANLSYQSLKEEKDWQIALKRNRIFAYEQYLELHPSGKYSEEAGMRLEALEHDMAWSETLAENTVSAFLNYLETYENGKFREEAERRIQNLIAQKEDLKTDGSPGETTNDDLAEETALELATNEDSVTAYNHFLKEFPNGKYREQVKKRISQLEAKLAKQYRFIEEELQAWEYAHTQNSLLAYRDFLKRFPVGRYSDLARTYIQQLEQKNFNKVRQTQKPIKEEIPLVKSSEDDEAYENLDSGERDLMGFRLAILWLVGFVILSVLTFFLARFLYPITILCALMAGGYFVYNRGNHIKNRESIIYQLGGGISVFFLIWESTRWFFSSPWPGASFSLITCILAIFLLRSYFKRQQSQK